MKHIYKSTKFLTVHEPFAQSQTSETEALVPHHDLCADYRYRLREWRVGFNARVQRLGGWIEFTVFGLRDPGTRSILMKLD